MHGIGELVSDEGSLDSLCRRYGVRSLMVFGSVARGTANALSDVDVLYEMEPGRRMGWEIEQFSDSLAELLGRPVDLVARVALHSRLRDSVLTEASPLYAA